jgi:hypothetical protein
VQTLGGHGPDDSLQCAGVRCAVYDQAYVTTAGTSFQSGCGSDPSDSGCCVRTPAGAHICSRCPAAQRSLAPHNFTCSAAVVPVTFPAGVTPAVTFLDSGGVIRMCGLRHSPFPYYKDTKPKRDNLLYSTDLANSNATSSTFLCRQAQWEQGEFSGSATQGWAGPAAAVTAATGAGSDVPLEGTRHWRVNYPNYETVSGSGSWSQGPVVRGEGVYACYNGASCIGPDSCTCADGWDGFDCNTPMCRHLQPSGRVSACENEGLCQAKDDCKCIQVSTKAVLSVCLRQRLLPVAAV